jgi:hypothetical protein
MKHIQLPFTRRIAWVLAVAIMVIGAWFTQLDTNATELADAGLKRALISFASARTLNAVISVAQGTEVAVQPAGVGLTFTPGQVLDPLNDLVEQFSNLMLIASVSFGVQKVLISIGAYWIVPLLLTITAMVWAFFYLRQQPTSAWITRILMILLLVRFAIPVVIVSTEMLFQKFMATDYLSSQQSITTASGDLSELSTPVETPQTDQGVMDRIKGWWAENADVKLRYEQLKQTAENAIEHIIKLMVIFLLQTLLLPLLLLWILYGLARRAFEWA